MKAFLVGAELFHADRRTNSGFTKEPIQGSKKDLYLRTKSVYHHVMKGGLLLLWCKSDPSVKFAEGLKNHNHETANVGRITSF